MLWPFVVYKVSIVVVLLCASASILTARLSGHKRKRFFKYVKRDPLPSPPLAGVISIPWGHYSKLVNTEFDTICKRFSVRGMNIDRSIRDQLDKRVCQKFIKTAKEKQMLVPVNGKYTINTKLTTPETFKGCYRAVGVIITLAAELGHNLDTDFDLELINSIFDDTVDSANYILANNIEPYAEDLLGLPYTNYDNGDSIFLLEGIKRFHRMNFGYGKSSLMKYYTITDMENVIEDYYRSIEITPKIWMQEGRRLILKDKEFYGRFSSQSALASKIWRHISATEPFSLIHWLHYGIDCYENHLKKEFSRCLRGMTAAERKTIFTKLTGWKEMPLGGATRLPAIRLNSYSYYSSKRFDPETLTLGCYSSELCPVLHGMLKE